MLEQPSGEVRRLVEIPRSLVLGKAIELSADVGVPDFTPKHTAKTRNAQAFNGDDSTIEVAMPAGQQVCPCRMTVGVVITGDEPDIDAGIEQRTNLFLEGLLRLDVAEKNHRLHTIMCPRLLQRRQDVIELAMHIAQQINHDWCSWPSRAKQLGEQQNELSAMEFLLQILTYKVKRSSGADNVCSMQIDS